MIELKKYACLSHQGPFLNINEDFVEVDLINNLFLLGDAFGGSSCGDVACQKIKDNFIKFYHKIGGDENATLPFYFSEKYLIEGNALINAAHLCHKLLQNENESKNINNKMGASLVAISFSENIVNILSIGNVYIYSHRRGKLKLLNIPETLENLEQDNFEKYFLSSPTNALGLFEQLDCNLKEYAVEIGESIVVFSDGGCNRVSEEELTSILNVVDTSLNQIEEIFKLQNGRGNMDNQSALILNF